MGSTDFNHNDSCHWTIPDSKVHGAYMGYTWGQQDPGGPHVGPMILTIWDPHVSEEACSTLVQIIYNKLALLILIVYCNITAITPVW